jgi:hypothetical protein
MTYLAVISTIHELPSELYAPPFGFDFYTPVFVNAPHGVVQCPVTMLGDGMSLSTSFPREMLVDIGIGVGGSWAVYGSSRKSRRLWESCLF